MKKTALVADDHEVFRVFLSTILKDRLGFDRIETVGSLDEVVAALERSPRVSLVLLDLTMPGMDGAASLARIRAMRPEAHLAVVSGSLDRGDMLAAMASGVHGYVPKALGITEMTEALDRVASGQVYLPPSFAAVPGPGAPAPVPALPAPLAALPAPIAAAVAASASGLPQKERAVLELLGKGFTNREIGEALGLAEGTVKSHLRMLFRRIGVRNRAEPAAAATMMSA